MITAKLESFLRSWHKTSGETQRKNGKEFNLSFDEFMSLWSPKQLRQIQKWCDEGNLYLKLGADNADAYVLSWTSFAESQGPVMHAGNAQICKRRDSLKSCRVSKGDKMPERSKDKISKKLTGMMKSAEHRANISASMKGVHAGRVGSAEESSNKSAAAKARWDRYRAEKAAQAAKGAEQ